MNEEIKEILECMEEIADCTFTTDTFELNFEDTKILLDYITNLQESEAYYYGQYKDYKSRCEKANWWLKEMLKQAKSEETKAIINGTLDLLLNGGDNNE